MKAALQANFPYHRSREQTEHNSQARGTCKIKRKTRDFFLICVEFVIFKNFLLVPFCWKPLFEMEKVNLHMSRTPHVSEKVSSE